MPRPRSTPTFRRLAGKAQLPPTARPKFQRPRHPPRHSLQSHQLDSARIYQRLQTPPRRLLSKPPKPHTTLDLSPSEKRPTAPRHTRPPPRRTPPRHCRSHLRRPQCLELQDPVQPQRRLQTGQWPEFDTVIITRLSASPSAPSATPRFASSHPQNPIVPAPRPFATFAPLRFKFFRFSRHPSLATHRTPHIFHS